MSVPLSVSCNPRPAENHPPALSVVIPAYNEAGRLLPTLEAAVAYLDGRKMPFELVVVDDGSRDETAAVAQGFATRYAGAAGGFGVVRSLRYETNRGKGHAVRYGIMRASGDRVLFMDADLSTPMEELPKLEAALDPSRSLEVAIGSRPLRESRLEVRQPWYRELGGRSFNKVVQLLATPGIEDTQCGFKLLTARAARDIFSRCQLNGFSFDVEALFLARKLGYRIAEVPVRWAHQEGAAAFPTKSAYLRQGLAMLADLRQIRRIHRDVRPVAALAKPSAPGT
ncbi:MAG: glycosyltransferase family 2 protein [Capsulimonadales bacterium]|nr:glycosyltransferase family 2 protein [Capsulimonadales bacterium]